MNGYSKFAKPRACFQGCTAWMSLAAGGRGLFLLPIVLQLQQIRHQIRTLRQFSLPLPGMLLQARKLWAQMMPQITAIFTPIPGQPEARHVCQGGALSGPHPCAVKIKE